jgi:hypothetical protein
MGSSIFYFPVGFAMGSPCRTSVGEERDMNVYSLRPSLLVFAGLAAAAFLH